MTEKDGERRNLDIMSYETAFTADAQPTNRDYWLGSSHESLHRPIFSPAMPTRSKITLNALYC
jgi:hypothetical protein